MTGDPLPDKGTVLEEVLRAYFLRAGFFVIRGVPFRFVDEDLTNIDLWLYERPTGTSRRVQVCDIKYKQRPKAVERIFWTSGLRDALQVDGAYIATTDKRRSLRSVAEKLNLQLIDGTDIQRIQNSQTVLYKDRIGDEQLIEELQLVDKEFRNKNLIEARLDILSALSEGFGAPSVVRALEAFARLASAAVSYHPDSRAARAAGRLAYLAAAITCESLDYVSVGAAFRTFDERRELMLKAVRLGALSSEDGQQTLKLALALIEKYGPGGRSAAVAVETGLKKELERIPAEIVADQAIRLLKGDQLFLTGRELEMASYHVALHPFDALSLHTKSMVGALLDYAGVDRQRFAQAWTASPAATIAAKETVDEVSDDPKKEPPDAPRGVVLSGAAAFSAAGQIGITPQVVLSGAAAFLAAGQIGTRAEVITRVVNLLLQTVIVPGAKKDEGTLIEAVALPWFDIIALLERDPSIAYQLPWEKWEEMIAGTYKESGFDEVILTPRSGDHGRDVIAIMKGIGSIRVIDSVKAYRPPHLVGYDDVRALIGVLHGDGASKGFLTTTSYFAPNMMKDPLITRWIPSQLELVNGTMLLARLQELAQKRKL